jgi:hypothetical protein
MTKTQTHVAQFYDLNVWGPAKGELCLTAYEWEATPDGRDLQTNTKVYYTRTFQAPQDIKEIEFLLKDMYLNQYPLTDYDTWVDLDEVLNEDTPETIKIWLNSLPDYKVPNITMFQDN